jgi:hypothetical protein
MICYNIYLCETPTGPTHVAVDMKYYTVQMLDGILTASNVSAYTAGWRNVKFAHWRRLSLLGVWEQDNVVNIYTWNFK